MKNKKKDIINLIVLILIVIIYALVTTKFGKYIYGSTCDWESQHYLLPDYFRKLFYSTGNLFPNFALNFSQNIYYFAYYGLLSPIILVSYLLPFIKMIDYIQIVSILSVIVSSILIYFRFRKNSNELISLVGSIIFLCSAPLLFHSHRHIMFIIYMPFLLMGLYGIDKYFKENKKSLLTISIFLIVSSNYFFSVSALSSLVVYGIYKYIEKNKKIKFKQFIKDGFKFLLPFFIGILMASIIIGPTFYVLLSGRDSSNLDINILELFLPTFRTESIVSTYSLGLFGLIIVSIIDNLFNSKKEDKFLSIVMLLLLIFPIFTYILNGTLYVNYKVLIPFIPLCTFMIINTLKRIISEDFDYKRVIAFSSILSLLFIFDKSNNLLFIAQMLVILLIIYITIKLKKEILLLYFIIIVYLVVPFACKDSMYLKDNYNGLVATRYEEQLDSILNNDNSIYRTANPNYILQGANYITNINEYKSSIYSSTSNKNQKDYYYNLSGNEITERSYGKLTSTKNIFYNMYMGNKYYIDGSDIAGYTKTSNNIYVNNDVLPLIYGNSNLMSKKEFNNLSFPYNMEALLKYTIVDSNVTSDYVSNIKKIELNFNIIEQDGITLKKENGGYKINSNKGKLKLNIDQNIDNILIIKFKMNTIVNKDMWININGIKNILTASNWKYHNKNYEFKYVISSNDKINDLSILFSNGEFDISNIEIYTINYDNLRVIKSNLDEFKFNKEKTIDNKIIGSINASKDEYLTTSIPYDSGFSIFIDGKKTNYEIVDNDFIGFKITKGDHNIEMKYESPGFNISKILTFIGFNFFVVVLIIDKYKRIVYNKS